MLLAKPTFLRVSEALLVVASSFIWWSEDRLILVEGEQIPNEDGACPVLVPKPLSRSFSLWPVKVGSLYLLRIARGNAAVGGVREIYGS